jgi:tetratricopeptide (TPR) repeat protein
MSMHGQDYVVGGGGRGGSLAVCLLATLSLVGCGTLSQPPAMPTALEEPVEDWRFGDWDDGAMEAVEVLDGLPPLPQADDDPILQVLIAELAARRGEPDRSLEAYLRASMLADDPRLAAHATLSAVAQRRGDLALIAVRQWVLSAPRQAEAWRLLGLLELREGLLERAAEAFGRLLELDPEQAGLRMSQLDSQFGQEADQAVVVAVLQILTDRNPHLMEAWLALARAALRAGQPTLAAGAALQALGRDFGDRQLRMLYGQALIESGETDAAILVFQQLVVDYPDDVDARFQLAWVLIGVDRPDDALAEFDDLLAQGPLDADMLYSIGLFAVEAGRPLRARRYFEMLLAQGEQVDSVRFVLGRIAEELGDPPLALDWYRQVEGDEAVPAGLRAAGLLVDGGDLPLAREWLVELRRSHPGVAVTVYLFEAQLLREAGQDREGIALMGEALTRHPGTIDLFYARALFAVGVDEIADAEADLRRILARDPEHAHALNALGYTLVDRTDRVSEGFELIRRAYVLEPDSAAILDSMGWALFRLGEHVDALPYLKQAWEILPDGEIGAHLGEVLWAQGRIEEARKVWEDADRSDPGHPVLLDTLMRLDPGHPVLRRSVQSPDTAPGGRPEAR